MDDTRTDDLTDHPFWRFSLAVYGAGSEACLALQDRRGLDVNLILFAVWAGRCGHCLSAAEIEGICGAVMPWTAAVVRPLRTVRRWIKAQNTEHMSTSKNPKPQLAGRKAVFENRRIPTYLRIAEDSLTHQTTRIGVFRGTQLPVGAVAFRDQVKACELQAEIIAQYHLFSFLPLASSSCGSPGDAVDNLLGYLAYAGIGRLEQRDYEDLSSVLCAAFEPLSLPEALALFKGRCFAPQR